MTQEDGTPAAASRRAASYGAEAERYDRARPSYPAELVDDCLAERPRRVLDIGCGTGIAGRLFVERGCEVVGVEHDPQMAGVARRHGLDVHVARFESWEPPEEPFDLAVCGQAWHWIDPTLGPRKAGDALRKGGRFAAFWNLYRLDDDAVRALREVYERHAPQIVADGSVALGDWHDVTAEQTAALRASGLFEDIEWRSYPWDRHCTTERWLDELPTHSDHRVLDDSARRRLLDAVGEAVDRLGGEIVVHHETRLLTASRGSMGAVGR